MDAHFQKAMAAPVDPEFVGKWASCRREEPDFLSG